MVAVTSYVFTHATVLDGTKDMVAQSNMCVVVENDTITAIGPANQVSIPGDAQIVDLQGKFLMPGLINMHVHFISDGKPRSAGDAGNLMSKLNNPVGRAITRMMIKKSAQTLLNSGVTTVRGAGDPVLSDIAVRNAINAGKYLGPRIIAPGTGITVPGGHGAGLFAYETSTPEDARKQVANLVAHGADTIKLFITGGVFDATIIGEPGVLHMSQEIASAACDEAHKLGLKVMAHVESTEGVKVALESGVDTVEHGAEMTPEIIELYKKNNASVTCTISPALPFALLDPKKTHSSKLHQTNGIVVCKGIIESAKTALAQGIPVGLGTDSSCPFVTQYDTWREVAYFARYTECSNACALFHATLGNAEILDLDQITGSIEVGKSADMIVLENNPLDNLEALASPLHVMCQGRYIDKPSVKHLPELDSELGWIMEQPLSVFQAAEKKALATIEAAAR